VVTIIYILFQILNPVATLKIDTTSKMLQNSLTSEWLELISDPYAVLGISVNADDRQILKRYYNIAKILHPDNHISKDDYTYRELANYVLTRLVNPAYEQLKLSKKRFYTSSALRLKAKGIAPEQFAELNLSIGRPKSAKEAELLYEKAIASYAESQYKSLEEAYNLTHKLHQLNLLYFVWENSEYTLTTESKTVIQPSPEQPAEVKPVESSSTETKPNTSAIIYAKRHFSRAVEYSNQKKWNLAVQELRDAIKLDPNNSEYYALLGVVHYQQKLVGMAKVYLNHALKLNPQQPLALKYAPILNLTPDKPLNPQGVAKAIGIAGLLSKFLNQKIT
jgi:curved DNA-binding protein CbpA